MSNDFALTDWVDFPSPDPSTQMNDDKVWLLELQSNHDSQLSKSLSNLDPMSDDPNVTSEFPLLLHPKPSFTPLLDIMAELSPCLYSDLDNHPCRTITSTLQELCCEGPTWGQVLGEMSHLICQHVKHYPMGTTIPESMFKTIRKIAMIWIAQSPFSLETGEMSLISFPQTPRYIHYRSLGTPHFQWDS